MGQPQPGRAAEVVEYGVGVLVLGGRVEFGVELLQVLALRLRLQVAVTGGNVLVLPELVPLVAVGGAAHAQDEGTEQLGGGGTEFLRFVGPAAHRAGLVVWLARKIDSQPRSAKAVSQRENTSFMVVSR